MLPLQKMMVDAHCTAIVKIMAMSVDVDEFSAALALVQLSAELIVDMDEKGMKKEVEALKKDWVNAVTSPLYNEIVNIDELDKTQQGRWKIDESRNRKG